MIVAFEAYNLYDFFLIWLFHFMNLVLETTWKQARNETFKVREMKQLNLTKNHKGCIFQMLQSQNYGL
jgi:hypothetical protein